MILVARVVSWFSLEGFIWSSSTFARYLKPSSLTRLILEGDISMFVAVGAGRSRLA